jgi:hypothetical protein
MKKIEFLDTPTLWKMERQFETPKNLVESMILKGIKAELAERKAGLAALRGQDESEDEEPCTCICCTKAEPISADLHDDAISAAKKIAVALPAA